MATPAAAWRIGTSEAIDDPEGSFLGTPLNLLMELPSRPGRPAVASRVEDRVAVMPIRSDWKCCRLGTLTSEVVGMKLIRAGQAARLLGVDAETLRRRAKGKDYLEIYGHRVRVYRMDINPGSEGRYDEDEIRRVLARIQRAR
jgi:hypothetical protein